MIDRGALWRGTTAGSVATGAMSVLRFGAHPAQRHAPSVTVPRLRRVG